MRALFWMKHSALSTASVTAALGLLALIIGWLFGGVTWIETRASVPQLAEAKTECLKHVDKTAGDDKLDNVQKNIYLLIGAKGLRPVKQKE
jgi:uncharacterized membrane protein YciS (DUF1049 family)